MILCLKESYLNMRRCIYNLKLDSRLLQTLFTGSYQFCWSHIRRNLNNLSQYLYRFLCNILHLHASAQCCLRWSNGNSISFNYSLDQNVIKSPVVFNTCLHRLILWPCLELGNKACFTFNKEWFVWVVPFWAYMSPCRRKIIIVLINCMTEPDINTFIMRTNPWQGNTLDIVSFLWESRDRKSMEKRQCYEPELGHMEVQISRLSYCYLSTILDASNQFSSLKK